MLLVSDVALERISRSPKNILIRIEGDFGGRSKFQLERHVDMFVDGGL